MDLSWRIALLDPVAASLVSMAAFGLDKHRARTGRWRIPETTLHLLGLAGGFPGGFLAMRLFRHKRRKLSFVLVYVLVSILSTAILVAVGTRVLGEPPRIFGK
jgi:uncharacterized membrane protein YsdA (DUF1294 family)